MVRLRLNELGENAYRAAVRVGLPGDAIRNVLTGHTPSLPRAQAICDALGLELYIGSGRSVTPEVARELGLKEDCTVDEAVRAIEQSRRWMRDAVRTIGANTEAELETYRRDSIRQMVEMVLEYKLTDPDHLRNAPFHAVPFATEVRPTGRASEVEFVLASVGLSFRRAGIEGWAEWRHLVGMRAPGSAAETGAKERDLIVLDTMRPTTRKGDVIVLDVSNPELLPGMDIPYLILSGEGLSLGLLEWVDDSWWIYSVPSAHPLSDGQAFQRRRLVMGDWVIGRVAGTVRGPLPFGPQGDTQI